MLVLLFYDCWLGDFCFNHLWYILLRESRQDRHFLPWTNISHVDALTVTILEYASPFRYTAEKLSTLAAIFVPSLDISFPFFASTIWINCESGCPGHTVHLSRRSSSDWRELGLIVLGTVDNNLHFDAFGWQPWMEILHVRSLLIIMQCVITSEPVEALGWLISYRGQSFLHFDVGSPILCCSLGTCTFCSIFFRQNGPFFHWGITPITS